MKICYFSFVNCFTILLLKESTVYKVYFYLSFYLPIPVRSMRFINKTQLFCAAIYSFLYHKLIPFNI